MDLLIYGLRDPRTQEIRYVGSSKRGLARPRVHAGLARRGEPGHKANWIRSLQADGLSYEIVVLERVQTVADLTSAEMRWIALGKSAGTLTNLTDGGDGVLNPSLESRQSRAEKLRGHPVSAETRRRISIGRAGFKHTEETRQRISASLRGGKRSAETRAKQAAAATARWSRAREAAACS